MMPSERSGRKDKNQNIQVFVRLRPLNQRERDIKSLGVIEVVNDREVVVRQSQNSSHTKKFTFDRAFAPNVKQVEVYQEVVSPLIEEVLAGYNCTVFAYGQTGTGKTHTMVGQSTGNETTWQSDPLAGIIPRALSQLFDELRLSNTEYTVRVSYLELYNEELFDLLATSDDNSKLRIYEDVTRKGSNIVNGLEEITVSNKNEVYNIMAQGQDRKRVATTLMNEHSSNPPKTILQNTTFRSHTVFTIVVHMRENSTEGEELVKIGKLNLVDLAGSENISKAGSDNPAKRERARECVTINQSLLTLGRVITALVERHPHIPYRESKLTRILQESLGGRTKTSIIATISPGHKDLEETMSTLEYAHRAKNIQNKPEVNQKMTKKAILKEYLEEIDRLKRDLQASRDKNGVYLATDTYTDITLKQEEQRKEIQELLLQKRAVEEQKDKVEALFTEMNRALEKRESELNETKTKLDTVKTKLINTVNKLQSTKLECEEQKHLVEQVSHTERALSAQARSLLRAADTAAGHAACLHDAVDKRKNVESCNLQVTRSYREQAAQHRGNMAAAVKHFAMLLGERLADLDAALDVFTTNSKTTLQGDKGKLEDILRLIHETMNEIKTLTDESHGKLVCATEAQRSDVREAMRANNAAVHDAVQRLLQRAVAALQSAQSQDITGNVDKTVLKLYESACGRVAALCGGARRLSARAQAQAGALARAAAAHHAAAAHSKLQKDSIVQAYYEEMERNNTEQEKRLTEQTGKMEAERADAQSRLQEWVQAERAAFEQRLQAHVQSQTAALEQRLSKKMEALKQERAELQARMSSDLELRERLLEANAQTMRLMMEHIQEWETSGHEGVQAVNSYVTEFDEGATAVSADFKQLTSEVVGEVDRRYRELLKAMQAANDQTEEEAASVLAAVRAAGGAHVAAVDAALAALVTTNKRAVDDMIESVQAKTSTTTATLAEVASSLASLVGSAEEQRCEHAASVQEMSGQLGQFEDNVANVMRTLEQVEGKFLNEEYKVYSPTGKTPSRVAYRYPRTLATTARQDRILATFRAMPQKTYSDDCIVVESDAEARSDSESSTSEDSALFVAPSPPAAPAPPAAPSPPAQRPTPRNNTQPNLKSGNKENKIVKSTSETNIYDIKKQQDQGKENANRSMNQKRPSKLPAPSSIKKPFVDRNGTDN